MDVKIHRNEVFSPDRDKLIINRIAQDSETLSLAGYDFTAIARMLGTFPYIQIWTRTPKWLFPITKLPFGLKWKDGYKYSVRGHGSIVLLCADADLYIKGIEVPGTHITDPRMAYIKDFEQVPVHEVADYVGIPFDTYIYQFYKECGINVGLMVPVLRTLGQAKADRSICSCRM